MNENKRSSIHKNKLIIAFVILSVNLLVLFQYGIDSTPFVFITQIILAWAVFMYIWSKLKHGDIPFIEAIKIELNQALEEADRVNIENIDNPQLKQQVQDREIEGWEIVDIDNSNRRVTMEATKGGSIGGHAVTGFLTGFWTLGAGNVAYSQLSKRRNKERIVVTANRDSLSSQPVQDPNELFEQLTRLKENGLITDKEYSEKREELINRL